MASAMLALIMRSKGIMVSVSKGLGIKFMALFSTVTTPTLGISPATFSRNDSDALVKTSEGMMQVNATESRHVGARREENLIALQSTVPDLASGEGSVDDWEAQNVDSLNGRLSFTAGLTHRQMKARSVDVAIIGREYRIMIKAKSLIGALENVDDFILRPALALPTDDVNLGHRLTVEYQVFTSNIVTAVSGSNVGAYLRSANNGVPLIEVDVDWVMIVDVTDKTNKMPPEYLSVNGSSDGVGYFATTNPNSVSDYIVTPNVATTLLPDLSGVMIEGEGTNIFPNSNNISNFSLMLNTQRDVTEDFYYGDILMQKIESSLSTNVFRIALNNAGAASVGQEYYTASIIVKVGEVDLVSVSVSDSTGAIIVCSFDLTAQLPVSQTAGEFVDSVVLDADLGIYLLTFRGLSGIGSTSILNSGVIIGDPNAASVIPVGDGFFVGNFQIEHSDYSSSQILTTTGPVIRNAEALSYPIANIGQDVRNVNDITFKIVFTPLTDSTDLGIIGTLLSISDTTSANNSLSIGCNAAGFIVINKVVIGVPVAGTSITQWFKGVPMAIVCKFSSTTGMSTWIDGVDANADNVNVQDVDLSATPLDIILGSNVNQSSEFSNIILDDLRIYGELTDEDCLRISNV